MIYNLGLHFSVKYDMWYYQTNSYSNHTCLFRIKVQRWGYHTNSKKEYIMYRCNFKAVCRKTRISKYLNCLNTEIFILLIKVVDYS